MTKDEAKTSSGQGPNGEVSWDRSFAPAPEKLVEHDQNTKLLNAINSAYEDFPDHAEKVLLRLMRRKQRKLVKGQW